MNNNNENNNEKNNSNNNEKNFLIFIIDDDPWYSRLLAHHLSLNPDYEITLLDSAAKCLSNMHKQPDILCIDFGLPDMKGDKLLQKVKSIDNSIPVIIISGQEDIAIAVNLLKSGADDYIIKGDTTKELLWNAVLKLRENKKLKQEVAGLKEQLEQKFSFGNYIIGQSPAMTQTFALIEKALCTNINVTITGETGTGKEVVAKAIHYNSARKKQPFIAVNMAAIPKNLMESELFGYEKGAFTGALGRKIGKFEEAQGGTIFLDEIAEMDLNLQSRILRVLQEREVVRVGGQERIKLDIRLLSATRKNLGDEVGKGNFREDLYYRIIGLPIDVPPLRNRGNDILILAKYFADEFAKDNKMSKLVFTENAKEKLLQYSYPGNVRELKAIVDLAAVLCLNSEITSEQIIFTVIKNEESFLSVEKTLQQYNIDIITYFLKKYGENVLLVARKLGIGKSTIYNMIKQGEIAL